MDSVKTLITGTAGVLVTRVANDTLAVAGDAVSIFPDLGTINAGASIIIQILIGVVTLWKLIKKPKKTNDFSSDLTIKK